MIALADDLERSAAQAWTRRLTARLRRRARGVMRALRAIGTLYVAGPLHAVRIATKKLRYTLELAERAASAPVGGDVAALRHVQDLLGRLHDLQILQAQVQTLSAETAGDRRVTRALDAMVETFEGECRALHAEFLRHREGLASLAARAVREAPLWLPAPRPRMARMSAPAGRRRRISA
jgi:CHAD domain-containing protein